LSIHVDRAIRPGYPQAGYPAFLEGGIMTTVTEIAPDVYRISTYASQFKLQFNQFLVKDREPLLFHTGMKGMFPVVREAVGRILDPATIRWIGFSHFESDECGSLNEWLQVAPLAQPLCTVVAALQPKTLAIMHGSSFAGDGGNAIRNLASAMKVVLGKE